MQFINLSTLRNLNPSSSTDGGDSGSSSGQWGLTTGSADPFVSQTEYLMDASGQISPVTGATTSPGTTSPGTDTTSSPPAPTLVGSANGLQFDLIWDSSVANAPTGFTQAIIDAAKYYTTLFSNKEVINIDVGYGEIAGGQLAASDVGESASFIYLTDYQTVTTALSNDGFSFSAANEPTNSPFLITSADAKTMGLVDPVANLDGYIGFGTLNGTPYSWNMSATTKGLNTGTGPNQLDLQAAAEHEISEVMGRLGVEGYATVNGAPAYTPLDLFNYQSRGTLALSANGGYFSVDDGRTGLGLFNDAAVNGGDIGDWASNTSITQSDTLGVPWRSYDAYDAFAYPGYNGQVSLSDIVEDAALGYTFKPSAGAVGLLGNYMASSFANRAGAEGTLTTAEVSQSLSQMPLANSHA